MSTLYLDNFSNLFRIPAEIYRLMPPGVQIFLVGTFGIMILIGIFKMLL